MKEEVKQVKEEKKKKTKRNKKEKKQSMLNKKSDPMKNVIIFGFIIITVVLVLITLVVFNVFNIKVKLTNKIVETLLSEEISVEISKLEEEYNIKYEKQFKVQEEEMNNMKKDLDTKENDLNIKEQEIENHRLEIEKTLIEIKEEKKTIYGISENIIEISKVVGKMKADNAANVLSEIEDMNLVRDIIFNLKEDQAAAVLENIDPNIAAKVTQGRYINGFKEGD